MGVRPIFEKEASEETRVIYKNIRNALGSSSLPIFFAFIGAFPEYLDYISNSLIENLQDTKFKTLTKRLAQEMIDLITDKLKKSEDLNQWINRFQHAPAFYHFQKDIETVFILNLKLAFIFIALREAVKGWAVAAKRLTSQAQAVHEYSGSIEREEDLVFDQSMLRKYQENSASENQASPSQLATRPKNQSGLMKYQPGSLEKDIMGEYFNLCRIDFANHMKTNIFWAVRIGLEDMILNALALFPHLIQSPINVLFELTKKYPDFPDLIYFLAEHFPTASVQRMMFSGYMKIYR